MKIGLLGSAMLEEWSSCMAVERLVDLGGLGEVVDERVFDESGVVFCW